MAQKEVWHEEKRCLTRYHEETKAGGVRIDIKWSDKGHELDRY